MYLNEEKYDMIDFIKEMPKPFLYWVCPRLEFLVFDDEQFIYRDQDEFDAVYFLINGSAAFVLEEYNDYRYIGINQGDEFGVIDIALDSIYKDTLHQTIKLKQDFIQR